MSDPADAPIRIPVPGGEVSGLLRLPTGARALHVLGHGAGTGMRHPFLDATVKALATRGIATLRFAFPYAERGRRRPDPRPVLLRTVREAARVAGAIAPDLPRVAGGRSMGGRMTSLAAADEPLPGVRGLVFHGFPLHRPEDPSDGRAEHLAGLALPMLFLQGTRDRLAELDRIRRVCAKLGDRATLHVVDGADHGFGVLRRSGRTPSEVIEEMADAESAWLRDVLGADRPGHRPTRRGPAGDGAARGRSA